jgi:hypothetical protein
VLAAGVEPTTSRLRSACTAIVLRQQSSFRLAGNQRPCGLYRPRERRMQRGAQPENSFIHAHSQRISHARSSGRGGSHARTPSGASGSHARAPLRARTSAGQRLRSLTGVVVGHSVPLPAMAEGCGPPPVSPVFPTVTLVRAALASDAGNRASPRTTNANRTTD